MLWEDHMRAIKFTEGDNSPNKRRVGYQKLLDSVLTLTSALVTSLVITAGVWVGESHSCWRLNEKHVWNCRINHKTIANQINMQSQHSTLAPHWFWVCMLGSTFQSCIYIADSNCIANHSNSSNITEIGLMTDRSCHNACASYLYSMN